MAQNMVYLSKCAIGGKKVDYGIGLNFYKCS